MLMLPREVRAPRYDAEVIKLVGRLMKYFLAAIGGATAIMLLFYFAEPLSAQACYP